MKKYTTFCLLSLLIFSLFGCSKPKSVANQPMEEKKETALETPIDENKLDIPLKYPVVIDKFISNTCDENHFYDIPFRKIDDSPIKPWSPSWTFPRENGGWISSSSIFGNKANMILIKDPFEDYDTYHNSYQRKTYFDDYIAVDPNKSKEIWKYRVNITSGSTTLIHGDSLFIGTAEGTHEYQDNFYLFCINKNTGKEIWKCPIDGITKTNMIYSDNKLYFGTHDFERNYIYCVDAITGKILFQSLGPENVSFDYETKYVLVDNVLYFSDPELLVDPSIYGFNIATKQYYKIWKPNDNDENVEISQLTYVDPCLLFEEISGSKSKKISLNAISLEENKILWTINLQTSTHNLLKEPEYDGKNIFLSSYEFVASIDPTTRVMNWSFLKDRIDNRPNDIREFMFNETNIYIGIEEEPKLARSTDQYYRRYLLSLDKNTGKVIWKMQKGVTLNCLYKDKLLVSDGKNLYMIDQK